MKMNNMGLEIINDFKHNVDLKNFESFCKSTYYLSDSYIIDLYKDYSNDEIERALNFIDDSVKLYTDEDYFALFIHLTCNKDLTSSYILSDNELEYLLKYLEGFDEIPEYIKNILICNKRKKYKELIEKKLNKKVNKQRIKIEYEYNSVYSLLSSLFMNPKKIFCGYDLRRICDVILNQKALFDFLQNYFGNTAATEILDALKNKNYNLLNDLIHNYKLDNITTKIKDILLSDNSNYSPISLDEISLNVINNYYNLNSINKKILKEAILLTTNTFKNIELNNFNMLLKQMPKDEVEEYLLKLREIFKGLCVNFDLNKKDTYQRELLIAKGLYYIIFLQKELNVKKIANVNILFKSLESFYKKTDFNKMLDFEAIYQVINILSANNEPCLYNKKAFSAEIKKIGGFISPFKILDENTKLPNEKKEQLLLNHFNLLLKDKDNKDDEIEASFELALLRQKRLLDLLYYDNIPPYYDMVINYASKIIKENNEIKSLNIDEKKLNYVLKRISKEDKKEIYNDYVGQINLLKQAYERIEELEIENKIDFLEKKQNLCKEIYALQKKELDQMMKKSEIKVHQKPIEVDFGKQNKIFDNLINKNELNLNKKK